VAAVPGDRPRPTIRQALERDPIVWVGTTRPDGAPHLVPLWFVWDGNAVLVFSKPGAQKVRNIRADPRVMLAVGRPDASFDVELVEAIAELPSPPVRLPDAFVTKYEQAARDAGIGLDRFRREYAQPIRIRPTRWLGWGGMRTAGGLAGS
jgi:PPOX class probable F420-dependent enzyme